MDFPTFVNQATTIIDSNNDMSPEEYFDRFEKLLQYIIPKVDEIIILDALEDYKKLYDC